MKCKLKVEGAGIVAFPCELEYEPPATGHLGPCANPQVDVSVRRRDLWFAEREAQHRTDEAKLRAEGSDTPKASWEGFAGDPGPGGQVGAPRPHPQDQKRAEANAAAATAAARAAYQEVPEMGARPADGPMVAPQAPSGPEWDWQPGVAPMAAEGNSGVDAAFGAGADPLVIAHQKAVELAQFLSHALIARDARTAVDQDVTSG